MDWSPFVLCPAGEAAPGPRGMATPEGLGDRLRTAAFAELQAREAFRWAAAELPGAPDDLRAAWTRMAAEEDVHLGLLLDRMAELGVSAAERPVSDRLWRALSACRTVAEFVVFMKTAEERGRAAEEVFRDKLAGRDPVTAAVFARIAADEEGHIALGARFAAEYGQNSHRCEF